jgi:hypothetical protein
MMIHSKFRWAMPIAALLFGQIACSTQPPAWNAALGAGGEAGSTPMRAGAYAGDRASPDPSVETSTPPPEQVPSMTVPDAGSARAVMAGSSAQGSAGSPATVSIPAPVPTRTIINPDAGAPDAGVCAAAGEQCYGRACCDGRTCDPVDSTYTCGGLAPPGGTEAECLISNAPGCEWVEPAGCGSFGTIENVCGQRVVRQLRRCIGSCYEPDARYQQYELCSCDGGPKLGVAPCCTGTSWQAVLCCDG